MIGPMPGDLPAVEAGDRVAADLRAALLDVPAELAGVEADRLRDVAGAQVHPAGGSVRPRGVTDNHFVTSVSMEARSVAGHAIADGNTCASALSRVGSAIVCSYNGATMNDRGPLYSKTRLGADQAAGAIALTPRRKRIVYLVVAVAGRRGRRGRRVERGQPRRVRSLGERLRDRDLRQLDRRRDRATTAGRRRSRSARRPSPTPTGSRCSPGRSATWPAGPSRRSRRAEPCGRSRSGSARPASPLTGPSSGRSTGPGCSCSSA